MTRSDSSSSESHEIILGAFVLVSLGKGRFTEVFGTKGRYELSTLKEKSDMATTSKLVLVNRKTWPGTVQHEHHVFL